MLQKCQPKGTRGRVKLSGLLQICLRPFADTTTSTPSFLHSALCYLCSYTEARGRPRQPLRERVGHCGTGIFPDDTAASHETPRHVKSRISFIVKAKPTHQPKNIINTTEIALAFRNTPTLHKRLPLILFYRPNRCATRIVLSTQLRLPAVEPHATGPVTS